jgi:glutathione S-transferase|tara:strand:- start:9733 stop:10650 length:918 start_codon:yes stop_codon:yes gene_type:complete
MIFYEANYQFKGKSQEMREEIESRSGTHQVPVLQTPENWMIADTTPLMALLDSRFPDRALCPRGPLGVLTHIVEEYFDEWIARTMVHYRWHYEESAQFASMKMAGGNAAAAAMVLNWGPRACRATGTDSKIQQEAAEAEYVRILEAAEAQLKDTAYLLGDRPTAVDCIVLGGIRAHTNMDPDPKKVTAGYPKVLAWAESEADKWQGHGELMPFPDSTPFVQFVLEEMKTTYKPYLLANRAALGAGAKAFSANIYGEEVSYLTRPYPPFSASMITDRIENRLTSAQRKQVTEWLQTTELTDCFISG